MHNGIKYVFIFSLGAAAGVAASWKFLKTKYEQIAQEEIDSVKDYYSKRNQKYEGPNQPTEDESTEDKPAEIDETKLSQEEYDNLIYDKGYVNYSSIEKNEKNEKGGNQMATKKNDPYIITPEDFGEFNEYDTISLTYYADGTLTDDYDEPVENADDVVGPDFADHFGEYEDDSVFVRNDRLKADYEILYDTRKYSDVKNQREADDYN